MTVDHKAIREALEKATPGPWMVSEATTKCPLGDCTRITMWTYEVDELPKDDYYLASKSPEWLRQLLDENERLLKMAEGYKDQMVEANKKNYRMSHELSQIQADKASLEQRLKGAEISSQMAWEAYDAIYADKAAAVDVLSKLRKMTPYGLYHEMIDPVLERLGERPKGSETTE